MVVVDTSAWIEWLIGSATARRIEPYLPPPTDWVVPTIVQLELAKWLTREVGEERDRLSQGVRRLAQGPTDRVELNAAVGSRLADAAAAVHRPTLDAGVTRQIGVAVGMTHPAHAGPGGQQQAIEIEQRLQQRSWLIGKPHGRQGMAVAEQPRICQPQPQLAPQLSRPGRALHQ